MEDVSRIISPVLQFVQIGAAGSVDVDVNCWRLTVRLVAGGSGASLDGVDLKALLNAGAAPWPFSYVLGGLFDGHARPVNVRHVFKVATTGSAVAILFVHEHVIAWNR